MRSSKATVSNAYNRPDQLSAQLRQRILSEAQRLGYPGPDPIAACRRDRAGLRRSADLRPARPSRVLFVTGLSEVCERTGFGLVLVPRGVSDNLVQQAVVDGFILHCDLDGDTRIDAAIGRGLPTVVVDGPGAARRGARRDRRSGRRRSGGPASDRARPPADRRPCAAAASGRPIGAGRRGAPTQRPIWWPCSPSCVPDRSPRSPKSS